MKKQIYKKTKKRRLVLTDEPASFALIKYTYTLAHNGLKVGAKIVNICSISKKKLKKAIFSSYYLDMSDKNGIFAPVITSLKSL